jgi:hypothetical protein
MRNANAEWFGETVAGGRIESIREAIASRENHHQGKKGTRRHLSPPTSASPSAMLLGPTPKALNNDRISRAADEIRPHLMDAGSAAAMKGAHKTAKNRERVPSMHFDANTTYCGCLGWLAQYVVESS